MWSTIFGFYFILAIISDAKCEIGGLQKKWPKEYDEVCGESYSDRIIGGANATLGQYPWIVRLKYSHNILGTLFNRFECGGSLITRTHIITAAHCVVSKYSDM